MEIKRTTLEEFSEFLRHQPRNPRPEPVAKPVYNVDPSLDNPEDNPAGFKSFTLPSQIELDRLTNEWSEYNKRQAAILWGPEISRM